MAFCQRLFEAFQVMFRVRRLTAGSVEGDLERGRAAERAGRVDHRLLVGRLVDRLGDLDGQVVAVAVLVDSVVLDPRAPRDRPRQSASLQSTSAAKPSPSPSTGPSGQPLASTVSPAGVRGTLVQRVAHAVAVTVELARRAAVGVHRLARRGARALVERVAHAVAVAVELAGRAAVGIDRLARRGIGTQVEGVAHAVAVAVPARRRPGG